LIGRREPLTLTQMRIKPAGIRSGFPITRFAAPTITRRESHLGLRRRLAPQITSYPAQYARVPLVDALRSAARGASAMSNIRPEEARATSRRSVVLRRPDSINWSRPADGPTAHRPSSRSATPWRG
jgi:hypothetical protein